MFAWWRRRKADKSGGTLSFLVQPEPPTLASYVSTSGPIGLVMPKVYEGLLIMTMMEKWYQSWLKVMT